MINIYSEAEKYLEGFTDDKGKVDIYHALRALRIIHDSLRDIDSVEKRIALEENQRSKKPAY